MQLPHQFMLHQYTQQLQDMLLATGPINHSMRPYLHRLREMPPVVSAALEERLLAAAVAQHLELLPALSENRLDTDELLEVLQNNRRRARKGRFSGAMSPLRRRSACLPELPLL